MLTLNILYIANYSQSRFCGNLFERLFIHSLSRCCGNLFKRLFKLIKFTSIKFTLKYIIYFFSSIADHWLQLSLLSLCRVNCNKGINTNIQFSYNVVNDFKSSQSSFYFSTSCQLSLLLVG